MWQRVEPERGERFESVGPQRQSRTLLPASFRALEDLCVEARASERDGRRQSARPPADDEHRLALQRPLLGTVGPADD
jgi:hypothetical protein